MKKLFQNNTVVFMFVLCMIKSVGVSGQGTGLLGHYYDNDGPAFNFTAPLKHKQVDKSLQFNWGGGSPVPGIIGPDLFSVRWTGKIQPKVTGIHTFYLAVDDGVRLKINGETLVDSWIPSAFGTRISTTKLLQANKKYDIIVEMHEIYGGAGIYFSWSAPGLPQEIVPTSNLYPVTCSDIKNQILPERQELCKAGPVQPLVGDFNDLSVYDQSYYVWEYSLDSTNWIEVDQWTDQDLPVAVQNEDRWYRRLIKSKKQYFCDTISITDPYLISVSNVAFIKGATVFAPKAFAGDNIYSCPGAPVKIGGNPSASGDHPPFRYHWDYGQFLSDSTVSNPIARVPDNTIFTLTVTDALGCTNLHQMIVYAYKANAGPDKKYCGKQAPLPLGITANPGEPANYLWTPSEGLSCTDCPLTSTTTANSRSYFLKKTITLPDGSSCETKDTVFVEVIAPPQNMLQDVILCYSDNNEAELGYFAENGFSYLWKNTKYLKEVSNSRVQFDCDQIFLDPKGRLGNPVNPNPMSYVLEVSKEVCTWKDTLELFMLRANGGNSCLDGKLGYDWHPQIPATYKWLAVQGPSTIVGPDNKSEAFLDPVDSSSVYQLAVSFRGVECLSDFYTCGGGDYCDFRIEFDKSCAARPGLELRVVGSMSLPVDADPSKLKYEWFPKVGLSNYNSPTVVTTDNVKRLYEVRITHPARPGAVCGAERVIPMTKKPDVNIPSNYDICKAGDTIKIGLNPSVFYTYEWSSPDGFSADSSWVFVAPDKLPAEYTLTMIDTSNNCSASKSTMLDVAVEADAGDDQVVCPGANVLLGTPDSSMGRWIYLWEPFFSPWQENTNASSPQPVVLVAENLLFILKVTDLISKCVAVDTMEVNMDSNGPEIKFENVSACSGSEVELGPKPIPFAEYKWVPSDGLSCTDCPNPKLLASQPTKYDVEITLSGNCGIVVKGSVEVAVFDTTSIKAEPLVKCPSSPEGDVPLNQNETGACDGCTYSWTPKDGLDNADIINPYVRSDKDVQYFMEITNQAGCVRKFIAPVRVIEAEKLGSDDILKCPRAENVELNYRELGECTNCRYTWLPAVGLDKDTILNPQTNITSNTKYTLSCTKPDGCQREFIVMVNMKPDTTLVLDTLEKCPTGDAVAINSQKLGECEGCIYEWMPATGLDNPAIINPITSTIIPAKYQLRVIKQDGCFATGLKTVTTLTNYAGDTRLICAGETTTLGYAENSSSSRYSWTPVTGLDNPSAKEPKFTPTKGGEYVYQMKEEREVNGSTCVITSDIKIRVEQLSVPTLPSSLVTCKGTCAQIGVDSLSGYRYQWSGPSGIPCINCAKITVCPDKRSVYKLTTIQLTSGCSAISEIVVDVVEATLPTFDIPALAGCLNSSRKVLVNPIPSIPGNYVFHWSPEKYFDNPDASTPNLLIDSLPKGNQKILMVCNDTRTGCRNIKFEKEVRIYDPSEISNKSQQICMSHVLDSTTFAMEVFDTLFTSDSTILFSYFSKKEDAEKQQNQLLNQFVLKKDTTLYVKAVFPDADCQVVTSLLLDLSKSYTNTIIKNVCEGESFTFSGKTLDSSGVYTFPYKTIEGCDSIYTIKLDVQKIQRNVIDTVICQGDFYEFKGEGYFNPIVLQDTLLNVYGCDSVQNKIQVSVKPLGYSQLKETKCGKYTWKHNGLTYDSSGIYLDTLRNLVKCDSVVSLNLKIHPEYYFIEDHPKECEEFIWNRTGQKLTKSGKYYLKTKTVEGGCDSIYQLNLTVNPVYRIADTVEVFENYFWPTSRANYKESGKYTKLYYTIRGCDSLRTLELKVKKYGKLWIPNIFSPNGDGSNDLFLVFANPEVAEIKRLRIFSRSGSLVFEKSAFSPNEPDNGWDGTFRGARLDPAVFTFIVDWEDIYGFKHRETGTIQLVR